MSFIPNCPDLNASTDDFGDFRDLGYEDAAPTIAKRSCKRTSSFSGSSTRVDNSMVKPTRRSSMKSGSGSSSRRATIGSAATTVVEVRMRGERFPVQRNRSIEFNGSVLVKEVTSVMDEAPHEDIWIQPDDFAKMKSDRRAVVEKHKTGTAGEHDDIRGLEKYLDRTGKIAKNRAWDAVLEEQEMQEMAGVFNGDRIAALYMSTTSGTPDKAAEVAKQDYEAIRDYLLTPRTAKLMLRRLSC